MAAGYHPQRAEVRTTRSVLVELYSFENISYELSYTIDVSARGARILSKDFWKRNQRRSVRAIQGNLDSQARIAYCHATESGRYAIGVELDQPAPEWGASPKNSR